MSVHEVIDVGMCFQILLCPQHQMFLILTHVVGLLAIFALQPAVLGPLQAKGNAPARMDHREHFLQSAAVEHSA